MLLLEHTLEQGCNSPLPQGEELPGGPHRPRELRPD